MPTNGNGAAWHIPRNFLSSLDGDLEPKTVDGRWLLIKRPFQLFHSRAGQSFRNQGCEKSGRFTITSRLERARCRSSKTCYRVKKPLTSVEPRILDGSSVGRPMGLRNNLKGARRRQIAGQRMRIGVRRVGKWRGKIKIIPPFDKCWISRCSRMNGDLSSVCLCVIPSIRPFVNRSVKRRGSRSCSRQKLARAQSCLIENAQHSANSERIAYVKRNFGRRPCNAIFARYEGLV